MMGDTMFGSGNDAHLSMFNRGSGGSVTDDESKKGMSERKE
jgi:hypothetical protein